MCGVPGKWAPLVSAENPLSTPSINAPHAVGRCARLELRLPRLLRLQVYGPHIGILYGRHDLLDSLDFSETDPGARFSTENEPRRDPRIMESQARRRCGFFRLAAPGPTRRGRLHAGLRQLHERSNALIRQL